MAGGKSPWGSGSSGGSSGNGGGKGTGGNDGNPWGNGPRGRRPGAKRPDHTQVVEDLKARMGVGKSRSGGGGPVRRGGRPNGLGVPVIVLGLILLGLIMSCFFTVDQNEEALVLRFGKYKVTQGPGIHFKLPYPIESIVKVDVDSNRTVEIGVGTRRENLMLTGDENIASIGYAVIWRVNDSTDYVFNLKDVPDAVSDVAESAMREVVGKTELEPLITNERDVVAENVKILMQQMLDRYEAGVQISKVELKQSQEPAEVREAFLDVVAAKQAAEQSILKAREKENQLIPQANAEADKLIQEARGYKESVIAESKGDADRFRAVYSEYKSAPRVTRQRMYLETLEEVYRDANKIVLDEQAGSGVVPYLPLDQIGKKPVGGR